jgi:cation diffusion facilitator family transporter
MRPIAAAEFPPEIEAVYRKARRLEWITFVYILTSSAFVYLTMGGSQAMRTSFFENAISIVPCLAFLICTVIARRKPSSEFPYGLHRATSIGHLIAALALCGMGLFLLGEATSKVLSGEKPTIGGIVVFDTVIWAGWPMLAALLYTSLPSFFLARAKLKLAPQLHDKILFADANMMKADWMSETATAIGVIGAGFGFWWLDPLAAGIISLDILKDGTSTLRTAVTDLMDRRPERADGSGIEQLPYEIRDVLRAMDWVADAQVRMREEGHIFLGEAFVVPVAGTRALVEKLGQAAEEVKALDWRVHEVVIMPVDSLPEQG